MFLRTIFLLSLLLLASTTAQRLEASPLSRQLQTAFRIAFGADIRYSTFVVPCDKACRATITTGKALPNRTLLAAQAGNKPVGWGIVDNVMGKEQPITYLLIVDRNLQIRHLEILAYRETRGGEIRRATWRKQFVGKNGESPLRIGRDIDGISGATISATAVSRGAKRLLQWLQILQQQKRLP